MLLAASIAGLFFLPDPWRLILLGIALVAEVAEIPMWMRFLRRYRVRTGIEAMLGERAEALEALEPEGQVRLRGHEVWNAICPAHAEAGESVVVTGVEGLRVRVEPAGAGSAQAPEGP